ncbi:alpha/beta-hydrolase [Calocera cornea HHB12733]|uniref:Alpha/beta-hydrolase n=1 Tax=Calocera cornea HHB12733 TaxID=1353952 RepID=A0A165DZE2_9BASI|nr:alpha/beta-hydrolase [Calocera cornea HHB12733]
MRLGLRDVSSCLTARISTMEKSATLPTEANAPLPEHAPKRKRVWMNKAQFRTAVFFFVYVIAMYSVNRYRDRWYWTKVKGPVDWVKCDDIIECGRLEVPLDYFNPDAGVASLALAKYPATNKVEKKLGTLFLNPGGPGGSGVNFVYRTGRNISELLDGRYDIVSWDPRGINGTTPRVECFASQTEQDIYYAHSAQEYGLYLANASNPEERASFVEQVKLEDARNRALVELCVNRTGKEALSHMGTSTVVRDLERLSSVLEGKDTPVNFWGFSYGTIVGSYFVNMFPHRVGRVAIDGVVDPVLWSHSHPVTWGKDDFVSVEGVFTGFLDACTQAGPDRCTIAPSSNNSLDLRGKIDGLLSELAETPLPVPNAKRPGALTAGQVRDIMFSYMYRPRTWPQFASMLHSALSGDGKPLLDVAQNEIELNTTVPAQTAFAISAITCVDAPAYTEKEAEEWLDEAMWSVEEGLQTSPHFGAMNVPDICPIWPIKESDFFQGPFNHTLTNDILIIGNTYDPITPLTNAKAVHSMLKQSTLIQHDGYGHCSLAMISLCTARIVREYFLNGTAPVQPEVFCRVTEPLFPAMANATDVSLWSTDEAASDEDIRLLKILQGLGNDFEGFGVGRRTGRY